MNIVTLVVFNLVKAGSKQTSQYETVLSGANPESKNECVQLKYLKLDPKDLLRVSNITVQLEKFDKRFEFNNSIHIEISASTEKKYHLKFIMAHLHASSTTQSTSLPQQWTVKKPPSFSVEYNQFTSYYVKCFCS